MFFCNQIKEKLLVVQGKNRILLALLPNAHLHQAIYIKNHPYR